MPDFDLLLLSGVIDSFGILEMISSIEDEFQVELDLAELDVVGLAGLYRAMAWRFDGLQDYFYFRSLRIADHFA